jgi:two-component system, OmpR family, sensor histidine kinase MtrB
MRFFARIVRQTREAWVGSLRLRMTAISVGLSLVAVVAIGGFLSYTIERNLFESRRNEVISETQSVSGSVQAQFDGAINAQGFIDVEGANSSAQATIRATTNSPGLIGFAILRAPGQATDQVMTSTSSVGFPLTVVSDALRGAVHDDRANVHYQSVEVPGESPGIVTGTNIDVPTAGRYDLVLVYNLADVAGNLAFVQSALATGGLFFVAITGLIVWLVTTRSIQPIMTTAATAERFADGNLDERINVEGTDVSAKLAVSFNRMAESISGQINRLATLSTLQQQFVSDVSHELRTPLTTIKLAGSMLFKQRKTFDKDSARAAELLNRQIETFEELLAELIELSRYDAGAAELELEPIAPAALAQSCIDQMATLARAQGSTITLFAPGGHKPVDIDSRRVRRIVNNFLSNALDHGEGGPIEVWVDSTSSAVSFAVRDHGVGMTPADAERVFDRFWRADPSRQRQSGGTGLGLAIALGYAKLHGGVIDVWSEPKSGACFRLTIPQGGAVDPVSPLGLPPIAEETDA